MTILYECQDVAGVYELMRTFLIATACENSFENKAIMFNRFVELAELPWIPIHPYDRMIEKFQLLVPMGLNIATIDEQIKSYFVIQAIQAYQMAKT